MYKLRPAFSIIGRLCKGYSYVPLCSLYSMSWRIAPISVFSTSIKVPLRFLSSIYMHRQLRLPPQVLHECQLVSLLLEHPTNRKATQQIHSHFIIAAALFRKPCSSAFNALLRCYSLGESPQEAFLLFKQQHQCTNYLSSFDSYTYSFLLKACASNCTVVTGIQVHAITSKLGFESHVHVQTALVNMHIYCGSLVEATRVFYEMPAKNLVTWNVMVTGLAKWGELETAQALFAQMPSRTIVSWTGIIDGYTRMNKSKEAIELFRRMAAEDGIEPSEITLLAIFPAISNLGALKLCQSVHGYSEKKGYNVSDIRVVNSLIDSYSKCGCIRSSSKIFEELSDSRKNLVSWTSVISGFAMHGMGNEAVVNFDRMERVGFKPNRVTFLSVLNACSHGGLIDDGIKFFEKMVDECQIKPDIKHYGCLIDMLGRSGRLDEAEKMALTIPDDIIHVVIWRTLLGACSFHGNIEMAERASRKILEMEREYGGDYVLMYNILAGVGRFTDAAKLRNLMDNRNAFKLPGHSFA